MICSNLEFRLLSQKYIDSLVQFFEILKQNGDNAFFHPHPLEVEEVKRIIKSSRKDLYYIVVDGLKVLGYGFLRGWDEGYDTPSLGIAVHPALRGSSLGKIFMLFLHTASRLRGSTKIRLKVYKENINAVCLYKKLGYRFSTKEGGQLIGYVDLG